MLPKPNSQKTDVLYRIINSKKGLSERDTNYNMFRGTVSVLRKKLQEIGVVLRHVDLSFTNKFGRKRKYRRHRILESDKKKAIRLYKSLF